MPGWTWNEVRLRNNAVFGTPEPPGPPLPPEEKPADVPEQLIEAECCKLLSEDGWRILKTNPCSDRSRGKGFGEVGMADVLAIRYDRQAAAEIVWFEWKARGGRVRKHQLEWHMKERARGAMTAIAGQDFPPTVKGFRTWYRASGLARLGW